jgi:hypothetical protein
MRDLKGIVMANSRASDLVEAALNEAIPLLEDHEEGDMLVEWVAIAYVSNPGKDELDSAYPMLYSNGNMPSHAARGLLTTGLKILDMD